MTTTTTRTLDVPGATLTYDVHEPGSPLLDVEPVIFPGDHGGFVANEPSPGNDPAAFAARLAEVLGEG